jgi:hypothetical protein
VSDISRQFPRRFSRLKISVAQIFSGSQRGIFPASKIGGGNTPARRQRSMVRMLHS